MRSDLGVVRDCTLSNDDDPAGFARCHAQRSIVERKYSDTSIVPSPIGMSLRQAKHLENISRAIAFILMNVFPKLVKAREPCLYERESLLRHVTVISSHLAVMGC